MLDRDTAPRKRPSTRLSGKSSESFFSGLVTWMTSRSRQLGCSAIAQYFAAADCLVPSKCSASGCWTFLQFWIYSEWIYSNLWNSMRKFESFNAEFKRFPSCFSASQVEYGFPKRYHDVRLSHDAGARHFYDLLIRKSCRRGFGNNL